MAAAQVLIKAGTPCTGMIWTLFLITWPVSELGKINYLWSGSYLYDGSLIKRFYKKDGDSLILQIQEPVIQEYRTNRSRVSSNTPSASSVSIKTPPESLQDYMLQLSVQHVGCIMVFLEGPNPQVEGLILSQPLPKPDLKLVRE